MSPGEILNDIKLLTGELISSGLAIDQNFPSSRMVRGDCLVSFSGEDDLSITLKNVPYASAYADVRAARAFNVLLIDGGVLQMLYYFGAAGLTKHRLSFLPSPDLLEYQNNSDIYELDDMYGDVVEKGVVTSPVRFDFDAGAFVEYEHPMSHLTLGQYKNCRIPVTGPFPPRHFLAFVLSSFYNTPFRKFLQNMQPGDNPFTQTITAGERRYVHLTVH